MNKATDRPTYSSDYKEFANRDVSVFGDSTKDDTFTILIALGMEVWTLHRRFRVMEQVLGAHGVPAAEIEAYVPSDAQSKAWEDERNAYLKRVFGVLALERGRDIVGLANAEFPDLAEK